MIIGISGKIGSGKDTIGEIIRWLTNPRITDNPNHKMEDLLDPHYQSFEDFSKEYGGRTLHTDEWEIRKYAKKLKQIASILTGVPVEKFEDQEFKKLEMGEEWSHGFFYEKLSTVEEIKQGCIQEDCDFDEKFIKRYTYRKLLQILGTEAMGDNIHPNVWVNALFADYVGKPKYANNMPPEKFYPNWIITDVRFPNEADAVKQRDGIMIRVNRGEQTSEGHASETGLDDYDKFDYVIENDGSIEDLIEKVRAILAAEKIIS